MVAEWFMVVLIKGLFNIGFLLLLLCIFATCIIPCLRSMVSNMVTKVTSQTVTGLFLSMYHDYNPVDQTDDEEEEDVV